MTNLFRQTSFILKKAKLFILLPSDKEKKNIVVYGPCLKEKREKKESAMTKAYMKKLILVVISIALSCFLLGCGGKIVVYDSNEAHTIEELVGTWRFTEEYAEANSNSDLLKAAVVVICDDGTFSIDWNAYDSEGNYAFETGKCVIDGTIAFIPDDRDKYNVMEFTINNDADELYYTEESLFTISIVDVLEKVE